MMNLTHSLLQHAARSCANRDWAQADRQYLAAISSHDDAETWFAAGCYFAERQQYATAIPQFMQALDRAQAAGDVHGQAAIFRNLAAIYRELGDSELARRFQRQTLTLEESAGPDELLDWSADALLAGKMKLAQQLAEVAGKLAEDAENIAAQADAYGQRGVIAARRGRPRSAVRFLIRAARGHQFLSDDRNLGADFQNLAEVCGLIQRFAWQRKFFAAAREYFQRAGMTRSESRAALRLRQAERLEGYRRTVPGWN